MRDVTAPREMDEIEAIGHRLAPGGARELFVHLHDRRGVGAGTFHALAGITPAQVRMFRRGATPDPGLARALARLAGLEALVLGHPLCGDGWLAAPMFADSALTPQDTRDIGVVLALVGAMPAPERVLDERCEGWRRRWSLRYTHEVVIASDGCPSILARPLPSRGRRLDPPG